MKNQAAVTVLNHMSAHMEFPVPQNDFEIYSERLAHLLVENGIYYDNFEYSSELQKFVAKHRQQIHLPENRFIGQFEFKFFIDPKLDLGFQIKAIIKAVKELDEWSNLNYLKKGAPFITKEAE